MVKVKVRDGWKSVRAKGDLVLCSTFSMVEDDGYSGRSILLGKATPIELACAIAHLVADTVTECCESEGEAIVFRALVNDMIDELLTEGGERMTTEAQKRAKKKYRERKQSEGGYKSLLLEFYQSDMDMYEYLQTKKPTATYIKELIRKDMENEG